MTEENDVVEGTEDEDTPKVIVAAAISRGRMPLPLVWYIRFVEDGNDSEIAKRYFTTPGKINDIKKNANFKYISEGSTFSEADIEAAKAQIKKNFTEGKKRGAEALSNDVTLEDSVYSVEALDQIDIGDSSIAADRIAYNEANPRKAKSKDVDSEGAQEAQDPEAELSDEDDAELDALMEEDAA